MSPGFFRRRGSGNAETRIRGRKYALLLLERYIVKAFSYS